MTEEKKSFEGAEQRHELWEKMGCPAMPGRMTLREYNAMFRSRHSFVNTFVLGQATAMLRILLCPACMEEDQSTGHIHTSALYVTIEDDVMTTWPAMGHFTCHNCGFEEWHPMKKDPRVVLMGQGLNPGMHAGVQNLGAGIGGGGGGVGGQANLHANHIMQQYNNALANQGALGNALANQGALGNALANQGALGNAMGMQQSARMQQLQDEYNKAIAKREAQLGPKFDQYHRDINSILGSWV